ncbi:hypothetical protein [uncultured Thiodictyon sp.]|uniref:hypothetical protein n=1 Tax=uncultured Thiodictyon sp. TaxID=1846217 RepID=UPI0025E5270B|nr:hypothetical protein [uncultured Thiodictyon sp.]
MSDALSRWARLRRQFKSWQFYAYGFILIYALLNIISNLNSFRADLTGYLSELPQVLLDAAIFGVLTPLAVIWFIQYFSTPLQDCTGTSTPGGDVSKAKPLSNEIFLELKRRWMVFAYGFMFFAMAMAIYPFMIDRIPPKQATTRKGTTSAYEHYMKRRMNAPISILRGCVADDKGTSDALACRSKDSGSTAPRTSWLIQMGGQVSPLRTSVQAPATPVETPVPKPAPPPAEPATKDVEGSFEIRGGLVIPLYLVIFSLIGGAISLTRRIPEYQKQSEP